MNKSVYEKHYKQLIGYTLTDVIVIDDEDDEFFDYVMSDLYDWGDTSLDNKFGGVKMCWINTL